MKLSDMRRNKAKTNFLPKMVVDNPLLILGLDLPFLVVGAVHLKSGLAFAIEMLFIHLVTMVVAGLIAGKLKIWQRVFVTTVVSTIMMIISREIVIFFISDVENYAGIYLYLMAVNGVTLFQANFLSKKAKMKEITISALLNIAAFAATSIGISIIREYLSNGTIWGIAVPYFIKLDGVRAPFFGFILIGFLLGVTKYLNRQLSAFVIIENLRRESQSAVDSVADNEG